MAKRGWPTTLEMGETLPGPPEVVWRLITDWERQGDWMLEARDFIITTPFREGVGVEGEATVSIGGITTRDRVLVTRWEPGRRLTIEHDGWVSGIGEMILTPVSPASTHLFWREELHPPMGTLGAIGMSVFRPLMKRIFERDLEVLASLTHKATVQAS
jgi:hypothetical protein